MNSQKIRIDTGEGVFPPEDFTGVWEVYWPNRQLKFRGVYLNGEANGGSTCWWENGQVAQTGESELGNCRGIWSDYDQDGGKVKETEYVDSNNFVVRWYENGEIRETVRWVDGIEQNA